MTKRFLVTSVVALIAGAVVATPATSRGAVSQPIAFNHKLHVEENGLECVECHAYVTTQIFAGLPSVEKCLECHEDPQTDSAEEEKIRQTAANGEELAWQRIYDVPDHVYYSHRRHVAAGDLECSECHGPVAETTSPPSRPLNEISMDFCMDCHEERDVTNDCIACHK